MLGMFFPIARAPGGVPAVIMEPGERFETIRRSGAVRAA